MNEFVRFPPHARNFNQVFISIASFQLVDTAEYLDPHIYSLPEDLEPYHRGFEMFEVESSVLFANLSVFIWTYAAYVFLTMI